MLIDIHTHHGSLDGERVIQQGVHSIGIHPWDITAESADRLIVEFENNLTDNRCISIGECGLDKLCDAPMDLQQRLFRYQIARSEELGLPVIIHCVKAMDELLHIRQELHPSRPWIIHGFRGKPQQLRQLLSHGLYVSFGINHNVASLLSCPPDRLFLETDDTDQSVSILYNKVCEELQIPLSTLENNIQENFLHVFSCNL